MTFEDQIVLQADDELAEQMGRFEAMGVTLAEGQLTLDGPRTMMLLDQNGEVLVACVLRLDPIEQVREMLTFYEQAILSPDTTRH